MRSSDEERLDSAIAEVMPLVKRNWKDHRLLDLRLLIITPNQWLRVYDGQMKLHHEIIGVGSLEQLGKMRNIRGDILAFFSRLEGLSILSRRAGSKLQGAVQGVAGSFGGVASIVGLSIGGILYNSIGGFTFLVSAGVILVIFIMSFRLLKN
jgi:hypothetical protein